MKVQNFLFYFLFFLFSVPAFSQTANKSIVLNKTFKARVGFMCAETNIPKPCTGYMVNLELNFKKDFVLVNEKKENECGIISENKYKSNYSIQGNIVKVNKLTRYGEPLKIKQLVYAKNTLTGKEIEPDGSGTEYIFEEIKTNKK